MGFSRRAKSKDSAPVQKKEKFPPTPEQLACFELTKTAKVCKFDAGAGTGKEQPVSCEVFTEKGKVRFGELKVGDEIYGKNGKLTKVTAIYPQGRKRVYEIVFSDGTKTRCQIFLSHLFFRKALDP